MATARRRHRIPLLIGLLAAFALSIPSTAAAVESTTQPEQEGLRAIKWVLDPNQPLPKPRSRSVAVAVHENACTGGRDPVPYIRRHEVRVSSKAVVITLWIEVREGFATCPGNPVGHLRVRLPRALKHRQLYDGAEKPPRKVKPGEDPLDLR
jgi:hypothetical protein